MISLIVASRGRPDRFRSMLASAQEMARDPFEVCLRLDNDDPTAKEYPRPSHGANASLITIRAPRVVLSQAWNDAAGRASGSILMHAADDLMFRTPNWDVLVSNTFVVQWGDGIMLIHGRDGFQDDRLATHAFISRRWVQVVGTFLPPYFKYGYNDTWLTEVADRIGRRVYLPELLIEHMHPAAGKAEMDDTYSSQFAHMDESKAEYERRAPEREEWATKLREAMR